MQNVHSILAQNRFLQASGNFKTNVPFYWLTDLTSSSGSIVKSFAYKSFGEIYSQSGTVQQPFTFTGREYGPKSGLYYYRARYYDPISGRFLTKDPIGFAGGDVNLYRYVQNNPLNFTGPTGEIFPVLLVPYLAGVLIGTVSIGYIAPYFIDVSPLPQGSPPGSLSPGLPGPIPLGPSGPRGAPAAICGPPVAGK